MSVDPQFSGSFANCSVRFVEFETSNDLKIAVDKLDSQEFKENVVRCIPDVSGISVEWLFLRRA